LLNIAVIFSLFSSYEKLSSFKLLILVSIGLKRQIRLLTNSPTPRSAQKMRAGSNLLFLRALFLLHGDAKNSRGINEPRQTGKL
jgi:hypothetical protein